MATQNQIEANRANSQKSTGPTSPEGKRKSALNRLSHGFASNTAELIRGEDPEEFKALHADLTDEYQPATPTEQLLVERMVITQWQIGRAFRLENDCLTMRIQRTTTIPHDVGLFIRYQTAADRAFHKAHTELVKAQKERKKSEIGFESQNLSQPPAEPPAQPETQPKSAPAPAAPTPFAPPAAPTAPEIISAAPDILKKAA